MQVMFTNPGFVDMKQSEIEIKEERFTPESFEELLHFMYTGEVKLTSIDRVIDVLQIAYFLQVQGEMSYIYIYIHPHRCKTLTEL